MTIDVGGTDSTCGPTAASTGRANGPCSSPTRTSARPRASAGSACRCPGPRRRDTLRRLAAALAETAAARLVILGDFWHAAAGVTADVLAELSAWRQAHEDVSVEIVLGNHDVRSGGIPAGLGMAVYPRPVTLGRSSPPTFRSRTRGGTCWPGTCTRGSPPRPRPAIAPAAVLLVRPGGRRAAGVRRVHRDGDDHPPAGRPGGRHGRRGTGRGAGLTPPPEWCGGTAFSGRSFPRRRSSRAAEPFPFAGPLGVSPDCH